MVKLLLPGASALSLIGPLPYPSLTHADQGLNVTRVYLSYFLEKDVFHGTSSLEFALTGGLTLAAAMAAAPLSDYLTHRFHIRVTLLIGAVLCTISQVFAGLSTKGWQLVLSQGVLFGLSIGLTWVPSMPLLPQWFNKNMAAASGIASGGAGLVSAFNCTKRVLS